MRSIANSFALLFCFLFIYLTFTGKAYASLSLAYIRWDGTSGVCIINDPSTQCSPPANSCVSDPSTPMTCYGYDSTSLVLACDPPPTAACGPTNNLSCGTQSSGRGGVDGLASNSIKCSQQGYNVVSCVDSSLCSIDLSGIGCLSCSGTGSVCGDDDCESSLGEDCSNCNEDCGSCLSPSPSQSSSPSPTIGNCSVSVTDGSVTETEASVAVTNPSGCSASSASSWSINPSGGNITPSGTIAANITNLTSGRTYTVSATRCGVSCSASFTTPTPGECAVNINSITSNSASASISGPRNCLTSASWSVNPAATISNGSLSNLAADTQYIVTARRCDISCAKSFITSAGGSWSGSCKGGTTYHVSGPPNTMTCAIRSGDSFPPGNGFFWQGKSTGSAGQVDIPITASQNFTWYSGDCSGNGSGATQRGTGYCESGSNPVYDPGYVGIIGEFNYPDGLPYDGFGLNGQGIPIYYSAIDASNDDSNQCDQSHNAEYTVTLDGTSPPLIHIVRAEYNNPSYAIYEWKITKAGYSYIGINDYQYGRAGVTVSGNDPRDLYRFLWPKLPANFHVTRSWSGNGYERTSCESWGYTRGTWLYDVQYPIINNMSAFKFGSGLSLLGAGQYPTINFTVVPPVTLTVNKTGSGSVTESSQPKSQTYETTSQENGSVASLSCPYGTITSSTETYGIGCNGGAGIACRQKCTVGASSCSITFSNSNCNQWYCINEEGGIRGFTNKLSITCTASSNYAWDGSKYKATYPKTSATASQNTYVTLTAAPSSGYTFVGWTGDCSGSDLNCQVLMDSNRTVTANFVLPPKTLTVKKKGNGVGGIKVVNNNDNEIVIEKCESFEGCSQSFPHGTSITVSPNYNSNNDIFGGWSESTDNECSGTNPCQIIMDKNRSVTGTFDPPACSYLKTVGGDVYSGGSINMSCSP